jgi:hypothetical protein
MGNAFGNNFNVCFLCWNEWRVDKICSNQCCGRAIVIVLVLMSQPKKRCWAEKEALPLTSLDIKITGYLLVSSAS